MSQHFYEGKKIALLTKHQKEKVIIPLMEREIGCKVIAETKYDTDGFGTFSREKKRRGTQLQTAKKKATKAMSLLKTDIAIASEGSFNKHPYFTIPWNIEVVMLYDRKDRLVISGVCENWDTNHNNMFVSSIKEVRDFADRIGFPEHYIILRPDTNDSKKIIKGINDKEWLEDAFNWCKIKSQKGVAFIETDMRAFANPTRMKNIEKATENLIKKIKQLCPKCGRPGFDVTKSIKGLPCICCGMPSEFTLKNICKCQSCKYIIEIEFPEGRRYSLPENCHYCNP